MNLPDHVLAVVAAAQHGHAALAANNIKSPNGSPLLVIIANPLAVEQLQKALEGKADPADAEPLRLLSAQITAALVQQRQGEKFKS